MSRVNNAVLPVVEHDGDRWRVLATGTTRPDGYTYCHLASTTRGRQQRNGWYPVQICDWIAADVLKAADIYQELGYASREDYLESLAEEYDVDLDVVETLADMLGPSEDFDGLVTMLQDMV